MSGAKADTSLPVLSVRNVQTEFLTPVGYRAAVRDVSFDLKRGERIGIVGESGSGKSALALSILGLIEHPGRVTSGEILLNGRDIAGLSDRQMRKVRGKEISLIYQDPMMALDPIRTIGEQLSEAVQLHQKVGRAQAHRQAIDLLRDVEVTNAASRVDDYPHQFSGGMRQRVVIAMALANNPDVLIADEPTTALDVTTQAQVLDLIGRVADDRGASVVFITHNLGVVAEFCTKVMVMYAGRIVERSPIELVFKQQAHPYTRALFESVPRAGGNFGEKLPTIAGSAPALGSVLQGCAFEQRCPLGAGREDCRTVTPVPTEVDALQGRVVAECHHIDENLAMRSEKS